MHRPYGPSSLSGELRQGGAERAGRGTPPVSRDSANMACCFPLARGFAQNLLTTLGVSPRPRRAVVLVARWDDIRVPINNKPRYGGRGLSRKAFGVLPPSEADAWNLAHGSRNQALTGCRLVRRWVCLARERGCPPREPPWEAVERHRRHHQEREVRRDQEAHHLPVR